MTPHLPLDSTLLSANLQSLQLSRDNQQNGANQTDVINDSNLKENNHSHKAAAESSTPPATGIESPIPDPNGLGWPGACTREGGGPICDLSLISHLRLHSFSSIAKSTLLRLNATPAEKLEREQRLAGAVRTILECLGEDPDREGLRKTPERYAKALMWMTRGYEERLKGDDPIRLNNLAFFAFETCRIHRNMRPFHKKHKKTECNDALTHFPPIHPSNLCVEK